MAFFSDPIVKFIFSCIDTFTDVYILIFLINNYRELSKMNLFTKKGKN